MTTNDDQQSGWPLRPPAAPHGGASPSPTGEPAFGSAPWIGQPSPTTPMTTPAPMSRRRGKPGRGARITASLLAVVVVALAGGAAYLVVATQRWQQSSDDWQLLAQRTATERDAARADLASAQAELTDVSSQLTTATARITELADEKAKLGDNAVVQQSLVDYQSRVSQAAGSVATALATCIDGQQRLITYVEDAEKYNADDLARFRADVTRVCGQAEDANTALQRELSK